VTFSFANIAGLKWRPAPRGSQVFFGADLTAWARGLACDINDDVGQQHGP
jgi:hypothetical protein